MTAGWELINNDYKLIFYFPRAIVRTLESQSTTVYGIMLFIVCPNTLDLSHVKAVQLVFFCLYNVLRDNYFQSLSRLVFE